jgi:hypothetical protein
VFFTSVILLFLDEVVGGGGGDLEDIWEQKKIESGKIKILK